MSDATVLSLVCPACGGTLEGLEQDVLFSCRDCLGHVEAVGGRFIPRPTACATAEDRAPEGPVHLLPLWCFRVRLETAWADPRRAAEASLIPSIARVFVTAFAIQNAAYFGDPGLIFTEKRMQLGEGPPARVRACVRGLDAAAAFVEPHVLTVIDRRVDVTGLRVTCKIEDARVWGIPFLDAGDALEDLLLGLRLPAAAVNDLAALRAARSGP